METPTKKIVEVTHLPETRPHGGFTSSFPGCPVCESLDKIFRKERNKKRAFQSKDKAED